MLSEKSLCFRRRLSRLTVRCPDCRQVWLAPGLSGGDDYVCKNCGAALMSTEPEVSRRQPDPPRPLTPPDAVETHA